MAYVFMDGFDKYGGIDTGAGFYGSAGLVALMLGDWTSSNFATTNTTLGIVAPLSANGQALKMTSTNGTGGMFRTIGAVSRVIGGYRFSDNLAGTTGAGLTYFNGATAAFSIVVNPNGLVEIRTGSNVGTVIATSLTSVGANTTHYLEWDVTIGASANYQIWLDGLSILGPANGNTGNSQASVNSFAVQSSGASGTRTLTVDDLYLFDSTTAVNNAVLNTNPVVDTQLATSDSQTQWTFSQGSLGKAYSLFGGTAGVALPSANVLALLKFTPGQNETLQSVSFMPAATSAPAKMKGVAYSDSAGSPNTLLSSGTEVVGVISGTLVTLPLVTPQALTSGTAYWIGLITDTALTLAEADSGTLGQSAANTYASGAPGTAPAMTSGRADWAMWGNVTGVASANSSAVKQNPAPQPVGVDVSYISSSIVNQEDLYNFHALSITPTSIAVSVVKAFCRNSDAGARTVTLQMKSAAVDSSGSAQTPSQSYQWLQSPFPTDPNTSAAWTSANLNSALSGIKVAS